MGILSGNPYVVNRGVCQRSDKERRVVLFENVWQVCRVSVEQTHQGAVGLERHFEKTKLKKKDNFLPGDSTEDDSNDSLWFLLSVICYIGGSMDRYML